jgi:hypothetical protein
MKKCIALLESSVCVAALIASATPAIAIAQSASLRTPSLGRPIPTSAPASQPTSACQPSWLPTFGAQPGTGGEIDAWVVFDDGSGPALYAGGSFGYAGGVLMSRVAKWNGSNWSPLGSGTNGAVNALAVFDDGSGPALYAGGVFTSAGGVAASNIAKWNGSSWSALGTGVSGGSSPSVSVLTVFDDGSGPALFAGGNFTTAGGAAVNYIAKWNGSSWSPLAMGLDHGVLALTTYDDGTGPALYAGGYLAGGIAKWNGAHWSAVGGGMNSVVDSLAVFDDGSGSALFAGGSFNNAGGIPVNLIAKWNGSSWSPLGNGMRGNGGSNYVLALAVFDDGGGAALYAGGHFATAGGHPASDIAKWNGSSWSALGAGVSGGGSGPQLVGPKALAVFDDGSGAALYVGGQIATAGGVQVNSAARWNGSSWSPLGNGLSHGAITTAVFDDGSGLGLFVGGYFTSAGGVTANRVAKWDGSSWSALGSGVSGGGTDPPLVTEFCVFDDGGGPALCVSGSFAIAGGVAANGIAKWNGSSWSALGGGLTGGASALIVFDDGSGPALYAGSGHAVEKWNGSSWSSPGIVDGSVIAFAVFDDGSGPALYVGGLFTTAAGIAANNIAKWNGSNWSALGSGVTGPPTTQVDALAVFDDGGGAKLYVGGYFTNAGGFGVSDMAKWSGSSWSPVGGGTNLLVDSFAVFDDGAGPALYAGGAFTNAGGVAANHIAKWNGSSWSPLGVGLEDWVVALTVFDHDGRAGLVACGGFGTSPAGDSFLAEWADPLGCGMPGVSVCEPGSSGVSACPCGNPPSGGGSGCNNSSNTGGASLSATGVARITYDTVVFTTTREKPTATSIVLQGDSASMSGFAFGQGVRCVGGALKRLYVKTAAAGSITAPEGTDPAVHVRSAALGDTITPGTHRYYGVYYRDPIVLGGCPASSTFNITQELDVLWML